MTTTEGYQRYVIPYVDVPAEIRRDIPFLAVEDDDKWGAWGDIWD